MDINNHRLQLALAAVLVITILSVSFSNIAADGKSLCSGSAADPELDEMVENIRKDLPELKGKELLQAHSNLCRLASSQENLQYELKCIYDFIDEAVRQGDAEAEGLARASLVYCWYNYDLDDSLITRLPAQLEAMKKNATWDYYYNSWSALIDDYIYHGKLNTALVEAEKMYAEARKYGHNYGIGVAGYNVGGIYQTMGRSAEAIGSFKESIDALKEEEDISLLLSTYNLMSEAMDTEKRYGEMEALCMEWKECLDDYQEKAIKAGYTPNLEGRYLYCTLASAVADIGQNNLASAEEKIKMAEKFAEGRKTISRHKLLTVKARYYAACGNYPEAIGCNEKNLQLLAESNDSVSRHTIEMQQAEYYLKNKDYKKSAELYHKIRPFHDQLRSQEQARQLNELQTLYELDQAELKTRNTRNLLYYALSACLLLSIIIGLYIYYNQRLKRKNLVLYNTLQKLEQSGKPKSVPADMTEGSKEAELYNRLCRIMEEKKLYANPDLNREYLAEQLGTNRTYLANAVKKYHGSTVTIFINDMRLNCATALLTEKTDMNINEIEDLSGFNSRATFTRLFREKYGMTPSEFRKISKEHQIE